MGIFDKLNPKLLFKTDKAPDLKKFIGRTVRIDDKDVIIKTIVGNKWKQTFYEINSDHLIGMLRFHAQMEGAKDITEEQFLAFEAIEHEVERVPTKTALELHKDVKYVKSEQTKRDPNAS